MRRTFTAKTRKEVTAKLDAAKAALEHGLAIPDSRTTVADFTAWWLDNVLPGEGLAPVTEQWYRDVLDVYVLPRGRREVTHWTVGAHPRRRGSDDRKAREGRLLAPGRRCVAYRPRQSSALPQSSAV